MFFLSGILAQEARRRLEQAVAAPPDQGDKRK